MKKESKLEYLFWGFFTGIIFFGMLSIITGNYPQNIRLHQIEIDHKDAIIHKAAHWNTTTNGNPVFEWNK